MFKFSRRPQAATELLIYLIAFISTDYEHLRALKPSPASAAWE